MKIFITLISILVLSFCSKKESKETSAAKVSFAIGEVSIKNNSGTTKLKKGDSVQVGDTILTGEKSTAIISFTNGAGNLEIQHNAEFTIANFDENNQELVSKSGNFWIDAKKINKNSNFKVRTPTSVAGIRGTTFYSFEFKEEGIYGVCHCKGQVEFKSEKSNYSGIHDTDFAVITKDDKTIVITPEDFKAAGLNKVDHDHGSVDETPIGKRGSYTPEEIELFKKIILKKLK